MLCTMINRYINLVKLRRSQSYANLGHSYNYHKLHIYNCSAVN